MADDFSAMRQADDSNRSASDRLSGAFPAPAFPADEYSVDGLAARYDIFGCTVEYEYDEGLMQCPVAAGATAATFTATAQQPQPTYNQRTACAFVRVNAPTAKKIVTYFGRRVGDWPRLPAPVLNDPNLKLLGTRTIPEVPILDDSGKLYIYASHVIHTYGLVQPVTNQDGFAVGAAPFANASLTQNQLTPDKFVGGLIG